MKAITLTREQDGPVPPACCECGYPFDFGQTAILRHDMLFCSKACATPGARPAGHGPQKKLLSGLDCEPGQLDLFRTDGEL